MESAKKVSETHQRCRLCESSDIEYKYTVAECAIGTCASCGLLQLMAVPSTEELSKIYGDDYFDRGKYVKDRAQEKEQERRITLLQQAGVTPGAKVLDAGCATGGFVQSAKPFFDMWGIDISSHAIAEAKAINPDVSEQLSSGMIEDQDFPLAFFDAIVLWDVIEHLPDPVRVLTAFQKILKPNGVLILSTPNSGAITARLMGPRWAFMTPPEHICLFDKKTMDGILLKSGFTLQSWSSRGKWVNLGFFLYKLAKKFPAFVPRMVVQNVQKSFLGKKIFYVPSGDIQYAVAQAAKTG